MQIRGHHSGNSALIKPFGLNPHEILARLAAGDRCVRYEWCRLFILATLRHPSAVNITKGRRERILSGFPFTLLA